MPRGTCERFAGVAVTAFGPVECRRGDAGQAIPSALVGKHKTNRRRTRFADQRLRCGRGNDGHYLACRRQGGASRRAGPCRHPRCSGSVPCRRDDLAGVRAVRSGHAAETDLAASGCPGCSGGAMPPRRTFAGIRAVQGGAMPPSGPCRRPCCSGSGHAAERTLPAPRCSGWGHAAETDLASIRAGSGSGHAAETDLAGIRALQGRGHAAETDLAGPCDYSSTSIGGVTHRLGVLPLRFWDRFLA
jgi:hypothetical protein